MKKQKLKKMKRQLPLYLMALPGILYLLINNYLPMTGLVVAFKEFNYRDGIWGSPWNGVNNFKYLFSTSTSLIITRNTLLYNLAFIVLNTLVALTIAILLNEIVRAYTLSFSRQSYYFHIFYQLLLWDIWFMLFWEMILDLSIHKFLPNWE